MSQLPSSAARIVASLAASPFSAAPPPAGALRSPALREGLVLPTAEAIRGGYVPARAVSAFAKEARSWLERSLEAAFAPPEGAPLLAVRGALEGVDALLGAWRAQGEPSDGGQAVWVQAAVTRRRVHLRLSLGLAGELTEGRALEAAAQRRASAVLRMDPAIEAEEWRHGREGDWLYLYPEVPEPRRWDQTTLIATDGVGLKLSFWKLRPGAGPAHGEGTPRPWFP